MLLVADSGSTKTQWAVFDNGRSCKYVTQGISPYFQTLAQIEEIIAIELLVKIESPGLISEIYYYGTGCNLPANIETLCTALQSCFNNARINVADDLVGSARAMCDRAEGVVCILGTGSSSGYYDGKGIVVSRAGLGFILGDEGSGSYLGKKLAQAYLNGLLSDELSTMFERRFKTSKEDLLAKVYKGRWPNRYLAGLSRFLSENRGVGVIEKIILDGLNDFFQLHILAYDEVRRVQVHFTGSISASYADVVTKLCSNNKINVGNIVSSPIEAMLHFHTSSLQ